MIRIWEALVGMGGAGITTRRAAIASARGSVALEHSYGKAFSNFGIYLTVYISQCRMRSINLSIKWGSSDLQLGLIVEVAESKERGRYI